jgi:ribonucleotide reductase alpha subunit
MMCNEEVTWAKDEVAYNVFRAKYAKDDIESPAAFCHRVASICDESVRDKVERMLASGTFFFGGRTMYLAGRKNEINAAGSNCYVVPIEDDTIEAIYEANKHMARIFSKGGGVGTDISILRPRNAKVNNAAKSSTGAVSFLDLFNETGNVISQHGRRGATMVSIDCSHPDIEELLDTKMKGDRLQSMNVSIKFTDEFMTAVDCDKPYTLKFDVKSTGEHIEKTIKAREFFKKFCECQWNWGDPGALFIDRFNEYNLLSGYDNFHILTTNPCVRGDTLILTKYGYMPIEALADKEVEVWNGEEWSLTTPKLTGTDMPMLTVKFSDGSSVDCTYYHKWVLANGERIKAEDLTVGTKLAKFHLPVVGKDNVSIDSTGSQMYTQGVYAGDGNTGRRSIALYDSKKHLINYIDSEDVRHEDRRDVVLVPKGVLKEKFYIPMSDTSISDRLNFLAGLIDTDGSRNSEDGSVSITSINKPFMDKLKLMLTTLGVRSTVSRVREAVDRLMPDGKGGYKKYHCQDCYRLTIAAWHMYKLNKLGLHTHRVDTECHPNRDASRFITVISISESPMADKVYCMNEPKNHTFIANGMLTGNCAELPLGAWGSCNLGSINLAKFVDTYTGKFCWGSFIDTVHVAVRALNDALDYSYDKQPYEENRKYIRDWRPIGLGVFGYADMLVELGMEYGSEKALEFTRKLFHCLANEAVKASSFLCQDYFNTFGEYDYDKTAGSKFFQSLDDDTKKCVKEYGLLNGQIISVAPTGSISLLAGRYTGGCEPIYKLYYERTTHKLEEQGKTFRVFSHSIEDLLVRNELPTDTSAEDIKKMFPYVIESHDVEPIRRVLTQATMQKYVDNSISSTVNLPESATPDDIFAIYDAAWQAGCKGITVFRDNCARGNILGLSKKEEKPTILHDSLKPERRGDIGTLVGKTYTQVMGDGTKLYITVNWKDDKLFEIFVNSERHKDEVDGITRLISLSMRCGVSIDAIIKQLFKLNADSVGFAVGMTLNDAYTLDSHEPIIQEVEVEDRPRDMECPECHSKNVKLSGHCWQCDSCGASGCAV